MFPPAGTLASLAGSWTLRRSIDNGASMRGTAMIARRGDGRFDYAERGRLTLTDGQVLDTERRYVFAEAGGGFTVWFAETPPRLFHRIALRCAGASLIGTGVHLCGDDRYDTRYEFRADRSFLVEHAVRGPRERYLIETLYTRARPF